MGWLLLAGLGIMWTVFLLPTLRKNPGNTVKGFERDMDLLAETEAGNEGRWIVTPRKGMTFIGPRARAQARARERRRRILVVLIESIVLSGLIGAVPPLRAMWYGTAVLLVLLGCYVWLLVSMKAASAGGVDRMRVDRRIPSRQRRLAPAIHDGPSLYGDDDAGQVAVGSGGALGIAGV